MDPPLRIALLIRSLTLGGAERQLTMLAAGLHSAGHHVEVLTFYPEGNQLEMELRNMGVPLRNLGKRGRWDLVRFVRTLASYVERERFDLVYSFLPTSNVLAALLWPHAPALVWSVRNGAGSVAADSTSRLLGRIEHWLRNRPAAIIANSRTGLEYRRNQGWPGERLHLVENGLDADRFAFSASARATVRADWGVSDDATVIGVAGRLHPVKGLDDFLEAVAIAAPRLGNYEIVIAGSGPVKYRQSLQDRALALGLDGQIKWLGTVDDMRAFYCGIDVLCSASRSEGRSNVLAEAQACGATVVNTRCGDRALVFPDPHLSSEPGDIPGLAGALAAGVELVGRLDRSLQKLPEPNLRPSKMVTETILVMRMAVRGKQ